ncbi:hypothetical protein [Serinicoccus profundi]|uniref:hypothetical protein n=1 Tax=Serinicoccus profundi TaxID=1078471 RepID=UPI000255E473|nr:hypothetical protein [Serinicoccus profundi]
MTADPRAALTALVAALETHLETAAVSRGDDDPSVVEAYERIAEAFTAYDDALMDAFGEVTPLEVYDEDLAGDEDEDDDDFEDDLDSDDDDDDDDLEELEDDEEFAATGREADDDDEYSGLEDEEYDVDETPRG